MNVDKTISINPVLSNQEEQKNEIFGTSFRNKQKNKTPQSETGSVFAGNLNMMQQDTIAAKQVEARKKAMKQIMDTFASEDQTDQILLERADSLEEQKALRMEAGLKLNETAENEKNLKENYNVTEQEQKDLALLRKQQAIESGDSKAVLTEEEKERLANMGPKTEYQEAVLKNDEIKSRYTEQYREATLNMMSDLATIGGIKDARLKSAPMIEAEKAADKILDGASKEVIGMILEEAKEHIDEKSEEAKEKEAEEKEKKKEEEKKTNIDKQEDPQIESTNNAMSIIQEADVAAKKIEEELKKQMQKIPPEDIAGISIDQKA